MAEAAPSLCSALVQFDKLLSAYERSEGRACTVPTTLAQRNERNGKRVELGREGRPNSFLEAREKGEVGAE